MLAFDIANRDGILGDKFLVNGKIQPFFEVKRRRYRFRWLNGGPSRFYRFYLTKSNLTNHPFWIISNDGNLLKNPVQTTSGLMIAVAERMDVIVDFSSFAARQHHSLGKPTGAMRRYRTNEPIFFQPAKGLRCWSFVWFPTR